MHNCLSSSSPSAGTILLYSAGLASSSVAATIHGCCQAYCDLHVCGRCFMSVALVVINALCPPSCPVPTVVSARLPLLETFSTSLGYRAPSGVVLFLSKSKICYSEFHEEYKHQTLHSA